MITIILLAIMAIAFIIQIIYPPFTQMFWFDPGLALTEPWRFITSIFLHGSISHILFNGYALFLFGTILERKIGSKDYLLTFFISGIAGSLFYYIFTLISGQAVPALGASGAIFGIFGAVAVLFPDMIIYAFYMIPMKMSTAVIFWAIISILGSFSVNSGIAHAAHLGGLVVGYIIGKLYLEKKHSYVYYYDRWEGEMY